MTRVLDILDDYLFSQGYQYCHLHGSMTIQERTRQVELFTAEGSDKFVFILSTRAGGLGLNLACADVVILFDSDWNPHADAQVSIPCTVRHAA